MNAPESAGAPLRVFAILLVLVFLWLCQVTAYADDDLSGFVIAGMREARERLQTGVYQAAGKWSLSRPVKAAPEFDDAIELFGAFDHGAGRSRFDETLPWRQPFASPDGVKMFSAKLLRLEGKDVLWNVVSDVMYYAPGAALKHQPHAVHAFDVRSAGLLSLNSFWKGGHDFSTAIGLFPEKAKYDVRKEADGLYRLSRSDKSKEGDDVQTTLWINEAQGFSPVRYELTILAQRETCETTWAERNGAWVPVTLAAESRNGPFKRETLDLSFTWTSVNEPVSAEVFELPGLRLNPDTMVVDRRVSPEVRLGPIREVAEETLAQADHRSDGWRTIWPWLLGGVVVLVLVVASRYLVRR